MREGMERDRARLAEKYGEERAHRMAENHRNLVHLPESGD